MYVGVQIGLVALGSAIGGLLRWGVGVAFGSLFGTVFPWGTFTINITGSFFLGWFSTLLVDRVIEDGFLGVGPDGLRLLLAVGFTGAYTTFSTYEYESHEILRAGDNLKGTTYLVGSVVLGLIAVRLGMMLARARGVGP
jgi:CrcB protein